jgi:hypothetical protein
MAAKIQKSSDFWAKFGFQVDYDVANWYSSLGSHIMILKIISCYFLLCSHTILKFRPKIGGFLYFGGHVWFKMATIANQYGRNMVQHVLLPVNIHFHWNRIQLFCGMSNLGFDIGIENILFGNSSFENAKNSKLFLLVQKYILNSKRFV